MIQALFPINQLDPSFGQGCSTQAATLTGWSPVQYDAEATTAVTLGTLAKSWSFGLVIQAHS